MKIPTLQISTKPLLSIVLAIVACLPLTAKTPDLSAEQILEKVLQKYGTTESYQCEIELSRFRESGIRRSSEGETTLTDQSFYDLTLKYRRPNLLQASWKLNGKRISNSPSPLVKLDRGLIATTSQGYVTKVIAGRMKKPNSKEWKNLNEAIGQINYSSKFFLDTLRIFTEPNLHNYFDQETPVLKKTKKIMGRKCHLLTFSRLSIRKVYIDVQSLELVKIERVNNSITRKNRLERLLSEKTNLRGTDVEQSMRLEAEIKRLRRTIENGSGGDNDYSYIFKQQEFHLSNQQ